MAVQDKHLDWLVELTSIPTASGCEHRVAAWVRRWARRRRGVRVDQDRFGNLVLTRIGRPASATGGVSPNPVRSAKSKSTGPLVLTAHMDHPAFVVTEVTGPQQVRACFRGGVDDDFFLGTRVRLHPCGGGPSQPGRVERLDRVPTDGGPDKCAVVSFRHRVSAEPGDVMTWDTGPARLQGDRLLAPACDNLASVAAALAAFDGLGRSGGDVRVLLTRAEEVGLVGAVAACRGRTIPRSSRVVVLECSRSYRDSPIGGGPIVRVGDRSSTFDPTLTHRLSQIASRLATQDAGFVWQRKLMPGGTCEATAFQAFGYTVGCLCLPLGNYHNMTARRGTIGPETISVADFRGLVRLLIAVGRSAAALSGAAGLKDRLEALFLARQSLLLDPADSGGRFDRR